MTRKTILEEAAELLWGTYGKSGREPLKYVYLTDCEDDHLKAILKTQKQVYRYSMNGWCVADMIHAILADRKKMKENHRPKLVNGKIVMVPREVKPEKPKHPYEGKELMVEVLCDPRKYYSKIEVARVFDDGKGWETPSGYPRTASDYRVVEILGDIKSK